MGASVPLTESVFINKDLARKLVNMILLSQDRKEQRSRTVEDVVADFFL